MATNTEYTHEEWEEAFSMVMNDRSAKDLIHIPGIVEILQEHFNNEIIEQAEANRGEE